MRDKKVTVRDDGIELAASAVKELADGVAGMRRYAKDKLIVLLLHDATGLPKRDIQAILDVIPSLATMYLRPGAGAKS